MKRQQHCELASLPHNTADFDAAMMLFHDAAGKRKTQTCAIALGSLERPKNLCYLLRRDTPTGVADNHAGVIVSGTDLDRQP